MHKPVKIFWPYVISRVEAGILFQVHGLESTIYPYDVDGALDRPHILSLVRADPSALYYLSDLPTVVAAIAEGLSFGLATFSGGHLTTLHEYEPSRAVPDRVRVLWNRDEESWTLSEPWKEQKFSLN